MDIDTLLCYFKIAGITDIVLDRELNIKYVGVCNTKNITLPRGVHGIVGTGFSGLDIEVLKLNKELCLIEESSLSNIPNFKKIVIYPNQVDITNFLKSVYSSLDIVVRGDKTGV